MRYTTGCLAAEYLPGIQWSEPRVVTPGASNADPPSDAIVLFDGSDLSAWEILEKFSTTAGLWFFDAPVRLDGSQLEQQSGDRRWSIDGGVLTVGSGGIRSKQKFGDCQVHLEWSAPTPATGSSQGRGNSGLFLMGQYEIQILDSYNNKTYFDGQAGAIYKQTPPRVNAMRPPGEWNTYDVYWTRPRFAADGKLLTPAYITAVHNGVLIQNHFELLGDTPFQRPPNYVSHDEKLPIALQDHGNPVRFRNIWVRETEPAVGKRIHPPSFRDAKSGKRGLVDEAPPQPTDKSASSTP